MNSLSIKGKKKHVNKVGWQVFLLTFLCGIVYFGLESLFFWKLPDAGGWCFLIILPFCMSGLWFLYVLISWKNCLQELTVTPSGVELMWSTGKISSFCWKDVERVDYNLVDDSELCFYVDDKKIKILSFGLPQQKWEFCYELMLGYADEYAEFHDTNEDFENELTKWLNRASWGILGIGGGGVVGLGIWNINNAAAYILFFGMLPVFVYIGSVTPVEKDKKIPFAKLAGFYALKLLALLPIAILVYCIVIVYSEAKPVKCVYHWLYLVSNFIFFGGMAMAFLAYGGYSPTQHIREQPKGVNCYHFKAFVVSLVVCGIGLLLKAWNEG